MPTGTCHRFPRHRIGLVCPEVSGHLNPLTTLGGTLRQRGHSVFLIGGRSTRPAAERAGLDFLPVGVAEDLDEQLQENYRKIGQFKGFAAFKNDRQCGFLHIDIILRDLPRLIEEENLSGLIVDQFAPAGYAVAQRLRCPTVIAYNALAIRFPWRGNPSFWRRSFLPLVRAVCTLTKLTGHNQIRPLTLVFEGSHGLAQITQQPAFFDFPRDDLPAHFHYTGPWNDPSRETGDGDFPWDWLDGRPLIYASMGTLQTGYGRVLDAICDAVADLEVQVVLTKGGGDTRLQKAPPSNVKLVDFAPQLTLLDRARLTITHAGINTVLESIGRGVPMLCLPIAHDQPAISKRVKWLGLGKVLPVQFATARRLRRRLIELLEDENYLRTARAFKEKINQIDGVGLAAAIVEQAFTSKQPVISRPTGADRL